MPKQMVRCNLFNEDDMTTDNKKIILLSDGTGNSAASSTRTNVWRLYDTLDLQQRDQVAFYDDGVGSQQFILFKLLGGAFGYGLKRNVRELYKMLCRSYREGDKIYLFGFSRGAFTVRVLAGMIAYCGLKLKSDVKDEEELDRFARQNYNAFRSQFHQTALSRLYRLARGLGSEPVPTQTHPDIQFIGVWDTVDAYGLPIDELSVIWDKLIFPIRFPDRDLSKKVLRACHAVSVDDERLTFHPLLWNEANEEGGRIEQVWFSGVHADVGGGYPMDNLSFVPLDWMISQAENFPDPTDNLQFIQDKRQEIVHHADWHGVHHDSRSGFGAYYRYKPRNIGHLCDDHHNKVKIGKAKIHRGVLERIRRDVVPYAPTGLPADYEVVSTRGSVQPYEQPEEARARAEAMNPALDIIFLRRWLYGLLLAVTALFLTSRFYLDWIPDGTCVGSACAIDPILVFAKDALPDFLAGWIDAWRQNPIWLWVIIFAFAVLLWLRQKCWNMTQERANAAWALLKGKSTKLGTVPVSAIRRFQERAHSRFRNTSKWFLASLVLFLIVYLLIAVLSRVVLHVRGSFGALCHGTSVVNLVKQQTVTLDIGNPCMATGIGLKKGERYHFKAVGNEMQDGNIKPPEGPDGFSSFVDLSDFLGLSTYKMILAAPFRRHIGEKWLKLMGRIDADGNETFTLGGLREEYTAKTDGELFLYVNDGAFGLAPGKYWAWPYSWPIGKNQGTVTVTVSRLSDAD